MLRYVDYNVGHFIVGKTSGFYCLNQLSLDGINVNTFIQNSIPFVGLYSFIFDTLMFISQ
jgi:hypothetical protein